jgi:hypothetical protein
MTDDAAANTPSSSDALTLTQRLRASIRAIESGRTQVDVLNAMLDQCLGHGSRTALLILRGDTCSGWKGLGFTAHGGNDEMIKRFNAPPGLIPELDRVRENQVVTWDGASLSGRFGVPAARQAILVPLYIKNKLAAVVYVDAIEADLARFDPSSIQLITYAVALLVDSLAVRTLVPSPTLG